MKVSKKIKSLVGIITGLTLILTGCSSSQDSNSGKTEVTLLIGKDEIVKQLDETISEYNKSQDKYMVKTISLAGQNPTEKITSLYASGNAPTIMHTGVFSELEQFKDKILDLTDMDLIKGIDKEYLKTTTFDGKTMAVPCTVEAFGFIYNKDVLDEAVSGDFKPESIKNRNDLESLFKKIEKIDGKSALQISPMDWSLGAHFTNLFFTNQSNNLDERHKFMENISSGDANLKDNKVYNNWVDTFDLMKRYNVSKDAPLSVEYDDTTIAMASGDIGMWFMGNWAYPQLKEANPDGNYRFLPVPISTEDEAYGNNQISVGVPASWAIDKEQSSKEEQEGAKDFLTWLYTDEIGQDYYVNKLGFIPIHKDTKVKPDDPLAKDVVEYMKDNNTLEWMNTYYHPTAYPTMGASLQKYLDGKINRDGLTNEIEDYWKSQGE